MAFLKNKMFTSCSVGCTLPLRMLSLMINWMSCWTISRVSGDWRCHYAHVASMLGTELSSIGTNVSAGDGLAPLGARSFVIAVVTKFGLRIYIYIYIYMLSQGQIVFIKHELQRPDAFLMFDFLYTAYILSEFYGPFQDSVSQAYHDTIVYEISR